MRPVDCPGESRMRENLMSGLGRGSRKRGYATAPAAYFTPDSGWTGRLGDVRFGPAGGVDADGGEDGCLEGTGPGDDVDGAFAGGEGDGAYPVEFL